MSVCRGSLGEQGNTGFKANQLKPACAKHVVEKKKKRKGYAGGQS